jgi:hypothetical protein
MHPNVEIGLITFSKLKLYFVKNLRDFNSCYGKYHQKMVEIKVGFNNMHIVGVHHGLQNSTRKCRCLSLCANPKIGTFQ